MIITSKFIPSRAHRKKELEEALRKRWAHRVELRVVKDPTYGGLPPGYVPDRVKRIATEVKDVIRTTGRLGILPFVKSFNTGYTGVVFDPVGNNRNKDKWIIVEQASREEGTSGKIISGFLWLGKLGTEVNKETADVWYQDEEVHRADLELPKKERDAILRNIYSRVKEIVVANGVVK